MNLSSPPLKRESSTSVVSDGGSTIRGHSPNPMANFMDDLTQYSRSNSAGFYPSQNSPFRDHISTAQLSRIRDQATGPYPSPDSNMESPPLINGTTQMAYGGHQHSLSNPEMPPPFQSPQFSIQTQNSVRGTPSPAFGDSRAKKMRLSPSMDKPDFYSRPQGFSPNQFATANHNMSPLITPPAMRYQSSSPSNASMRIPPTPAASSIASEDVHQSMPVPSPQPVPSPHPPPQESPDFRRLSVKSLLSEDSPADSGSSSDSVFPGKLNTSSFAISQKTVYGIDRGFPDLDTPRNDDQNALNGMTPNMGSAHLATDGDNNDEGFSGYGFGLNTTDGFQEGAAYYYKPVTVEISESFEPLPDMLRDNPMNLLYFHHFLNHTARMLVPHDCSENPFKSILPQSEHFRNRHVQPLADPSAQWLSEISTYCTSY